MKSALFLDSEVKYHVILLPEFTDCIGEFKRSPRTYMNQEFTRRYHMKPIELSDRDQLKKYCENITQPLAEHSFSSWFIWGKPLNLHWTVYCEHLCLFIGGQELTLFTPPLKSTAAKDGDFVNAIRFAFEVMDSWNMESSSKESSSIEYIPEQLTGEFSEILDAIEILPSGNDYVYDTKSMIELSGSQLKSKRHAKAKFIRDFPEHSVELYQEKHKSDCLALLSSWARHRNTHDNNGSNKSNITLTSLVDRDHDAVTLALTHWQELELRGMVVYVGDRLAGFTFGEALSQTQASIIIEKTDAEFPGCPQFIFSEFCRLVWPEFSECNVGDDWGIANLTFTKMSYRPKKLLQKFSVRYRRELSVAV